MGALNWGKWLDRLGIKSDQEPTLVRTIQPVFVVGDHSHLVSPVARASGIVGGAPIGSAIPPLGVPVVRVTTPVPLRVRFHAWSSNTNLGFYVSTTGAVPAVDNLSTLNTGALHGDQGGLGQFNEGQQSWWVRGTIPATDDLVLNSASYPNIRAQNQGQWSEWIPVPAGGWALWYGKTITGNLTLCAHFEELPPEQAP